MENQLLNTKVLGLMDIYDRCVKNPRDILNLEVPKIKKGELANLTLFNLNENWKYNESVSFSKSQNTPFKEHPLSGRGVCVINKGKIFKSPTLK